MSSKKAKQDKEIQILTEMIKLYCEKHKHKQHGLCKTCEELLAYAIERIKRCPFMETKTFCSNCQVHCFKNEYREEIKKVMRYAGPRILFRHPFLALQHLWLSKGEKRQ